MIGTGKVIQALATALVCAVPISTATANATDLPEGAYFGQDPPGPVPEVFAPGFISTEAYETAGSFGPEGNEFFFTRRPDAQGRDNRLFVTNVVDGLWTPPAPPAFAANVVEHEPHVDPAGEFLFFHSSRPKPAAQAGSGSIWYCRRTDDGWGEARYLDGPIAQGQAMYVSSTGAGDLYFCGAYGRRYGIFRSRRSNTGYGPPEYLPPEINSVMPSHPFITSDASMLLFDAYTAGPARPELYVSFRRADGSWTSAAKLGPEINATGTEYAPSLSPDGRFLFFHREVDGNGDIWWVDAAVLDAYGP